MPAKYNRSIALWRDMMPDYTHVLWGEADIRHLVQTGYDWLLPTFDSYSLIQKVDAAKLLVLYTYGGLYLDLDIQPRPLVASDLLSQHIDVLRRYPAAVAAVDYDLVDATRGSLGNDFLMAEPGHPFVSRLLRRLMHHRRWYITWHWTVLFSSGPGLVSSECARAAPMTQRVHVIYNASTYLENDRSYAWGGSWDQSVLGQMVQTTLPSLWRVLEGKTAGILNSMSWPDRVFLGAMLWISSVAWVIWTLTSPIAWVDAADLEGSTSQGCSGAEAL
jgi:mannosyltransferase OCH1-like enzyme